MKPIAFHRCRYLIVLAATLGMAMPALANGPATKRNTGAARPATPTTGAARVLKATMARPSVGKPRVAWQTSWETPATRSGVTKVSRQSEKLRATGGTTAQNIAFTGLTSSGKWGNDKTVGTLVFEPKPQGKHRLLLRLPNNNTLEVLPTRKSSGAAGTTTRGTNNRIRLINPGGMMGRIELVQFFKAAQTGKRNSYYAAYGEENLAGAGRTKQILTHIVNITTKRVMSIPYNFISVWNGTTTNDAYVLVEPLTAKGKPDVGKVLGIPIHLLKNDFAGTLADPSKWIVKVGTR